MRKSKKAGGIILPVFFIHSNPKNPDSLSI